jgi:selenocysteine lyase/cysteine desulfurase
MKRREFIVRSAVAALAPGTLAACGHSVAPTLEGWAAVRASFALREGDRNLTAWWLAAHPEPVRAAIERHRAGLDADSRRYLTRREALEDDVRAAAGAYLETSADQIALTDSTTMGLGLLYAGSRSLVAASSSRARTTSMRRTKRCASGPNETAAR